MSLRAWASGSPSAWELVPVWVFRPPGRSARNQAETVPGLDRAVKAQGRGQVEMAPGQGPVVREQGRGRVESVRDQDPGANW